MDDGRVRSLAGAILEYWFSSLDDAACLDPNAEPFRSCYARWYGKEQAIDDEIRKLFEPALKGVTRDGQRWDQEVDAWRRAANGLLALTVLLDQLPRNMYRDSPAMYAYDPLALSVASVAMREYDAAPLSLVQRMFLYLPLMHAESLTLQQAMLVRFEGLAELAATRSPHNVRFFQFALDYAQRHCDVVRQFGRFPHRNRILGRRSTAAELEFLERADSSF